MLSAINGSAIVRGSSWLKDDMGGQILPKGIDLIEDVHQAKAVAVYQEFAESNQAVYNARQGT